MSSVQLVNADIGFGSNIVARPSYKKLIFIARHNYFPERTRIYTGVDGLVADGIPTDSTIYKALSTAWGQDQTIDEIKVGRFESKSIITPVDAVVGKEYSITLNAKDAAAEAVISHTYASGDQEAIVDALIAGIAGAADIAAKVTATKVGTGAAATLELTHAVSGDWFTVSELVNVEESFEATPEGTAADELSAIALEDDDFYVVTSDVKDSVFVTALAADMAARFGVYAVSLAESDAYTGIATGTFKTLIEDNGYLDVYPIYSDLATTLFPEVAEWASALPRFELGITMANQTLTGVTVAKTVDGENLTSNQIANLQANGINFYAKTKITGSTVAQRLNAVITTGKDGGGRMASGEYAMNVVGKDAMQIEIEAAETELLTSQKFGRLTWDEDSFAKIRGRINKTLTFFADPEGWNLIYPKDDVDSGYTITTPELNTITAAQRLSGLLSNVKFLAYLKDAIHLVSISGNLDRPA